LSHKSVIMPHHRSKSSGGYEESWEPGIAQRIEKLVRAKDNEDPSGETPFPYCMVALVGVPGSGKTISSFLLATILENNGIGTMVMPHDGYHYPIDVLENFPDAADAIYRRGAPDTFDPQALLRDLRRIDGSCDTVSVYSNNGDGGGGDHLPNHISLPGFDHSRGDPEPGAHTFDRTRHKVVICEGVYLLHDGDGWEEVASVFDLTIFMESDIDICIDRLKIRNQCIPGYTPEEIAIRCEQVDRVNAMTVVKSKHRADIVVKSKSQPIQKDEMPDSPTAQAKALQRLEQKDTEEAGHRRDNSDWTMDIGLIMSRPRSDSFGALSRNNSFISTTSVKSQNSVPPPPASSFVGSWEPEQAKIIIEAVKQRIESNPPGNMPYMVALVGTPGSGKSVSSFMLASMLEEGGYPTQIFPHDGYHYPLDYLRTFPDADDFVYRRGAPDTFDPRALLRDLDRLKNGTESVIKLPAFDHAKADPEPDTHIFDRKTHKIVLCEGLYLLHDQDGWEDIAGMFDYTIFMNSDVDVCIERVKIRNQCIPGYTREQIEERCEKVDRTNAMTVIRSQTRANVIVNSSAMKK